MRLQWVILLQLPLLCMAQTFSVANLPANDLSSHGVSVRPMDDGYMVFSAKFGTDTTYDCHTEKYDMDGDIQWEKHWNAPFHSFYGFYDPVSPTLPDGGHIACVTSFDETEHHLWAYRFNSNGDTVWTRHLGTDLMKATRSAAFNDGGYYFAGLTKSAEEDPTEAFVIRTDTSGNIISEERFPLLEYDNISVHAGMDNEIFLAGMKTIDGGPYRCRLMRLDTALTQVWARDLMVTIPGWNAYSVYMTNVVTDTDGHPVVSGTCIDELEFPQGITEFYVAKFHRSNGSLIWAERFQVSDTYFGSVGDLTVATNGDIIFCGYTTPPDQGLLACVLRYDQVGEPIWDRYYRFLTNPDAWNDLVDVEEVSDGGLILTGTTRLSSQYGTVLWLLRLDEDGCLEPGCGNIGISEYYMDLPEGTLTVTPNPAHDHIFVAIDVPAEILPDGPFEILITSASGTLLQEIEIGAHQRLLQLDVTNLPAGLVVVHLVQGSKHLKSRKIVVR
jgi:hypothetical protein